MLTLVVAMLAMMRCHNDDSDTHHPFATLHPQTPHRSCLLVVVHGGAVLPGFLMPGKPAVACIEGPATAIAAFMKHVRTVLFATVPAASRKMQTARIDAGYAVACHR